MNQGQLMKTKLVTICLVVGTLLGSFARADVDSNSGLPQPVTFVKDSPITTAVKAKLAAEHITDVAAIHIETDTDGVVWLTGNVRTREAADRIASLARATKQVTAVYNDLKINKDDRASG
jgi:hyperosmotically inducible periplasmic protein